MDINQLNTIDQQELAVALTKCCGAQKWVAGVLQARPFSDEAHLLQAADDAWASCGEADWLEAFTHHPKIGDIESLAKKFASTSQWASGEQSGTATASQEVLQGLADGNQAYEDKFGFIFIVCATGKSASEMLELLQARLPNEREKELQIAAGEQHKITRLRLEKLLQQTP